MTSITRRSSDGQTVTFTYQGTQYEIDLSEKNAKKLDTALSPFLAAARRVGGRSSRTSRTTAAAVDTTAVRKWAESNRIEVSSRGRIPGQVIEQYRAAGN
jgi:hypothetical protein